MEDLFPKKDGIDYSNLRTTEEGSYSITRRRDAERILNILTTIFKDTKNMIITDATACIGGDTLNFALKFHHVHSIEINEENFEILTNNVGIYGCKNVTLYKGDCINIFDWKTNVLYVDPPWGGREYKQHKSLDLYLSNKRLDCWIEEILFRKNRPDYIILKLPSNYNFKRLNFLRNIEYIRPYQIRTYVIIVINVHQPKPIK
jgi:16S rRNA G966 N2-methylase RsmD